MAIASFVALTALSLFVSTVSCAYFPSVPGNLTFEGYFDVHSNDGTAQQKCGEIDTQNAVAYLEAFRYATNLSNSYKQGIFSFGYEIKDTCDSQTKLKTTVLTTCMQMYTSGTFGLVGPSSSDAAMEISRVVNVWGITAVSYGAGSSNLDDRHRHESIFRTIPTDDEQRKAIIGLISYFKWTFFSAVASCTSYDQQGLTLFANLAKSAKRCLSRKTILPCIRSSDSYEKEMTAILKDSRVRVLVLLTRKDDTIGLLKAAKKLGIAKGRLVWVAGTGWGNLDLKKDDIEDVAMGALSLIYAPKSSTTTEIFKKHFLSLNPRNNNYGYFIEFWEEVFNCSTGLRANSKKHVNCTGKEKLKEGRGWHPFTNVEPIFDAVAALYRGVLAKVPNCYLPTVFCVPHALTRVRNLPAWLLANSFWDVFGTRNVSFDSQGAMKSQLRILNFAPSRNGNAYKEVGTWDPSLARDNLRITDDIYWANQQEGGAPSSVCSNPCRSEYGEYSIPEKNEDLRFCCWTCRKCKIDEKVVNNTCSPCGSKERPTKLRDKCEELPEITVRYSDPISIAVLCFTVSGFLATTVVLLLFIKFYSSRIVKASGREASFFMLLGIHLCFVTPVIFLSKPTKVICGIQRFIAGLSFTIVYAPLFLKTNRIFRIFQSAKSTTARPSLISPVSQVLISLGIVSIQLLLGIVWVIGDPPSVALNYSSNRDYATLYCKSDPYTMVLNLITCLVMMLGCTWYAFRTRHFPKNYNEAKSIMFTLYFSCFAWGVFLPTYLLSSDLQSFFRTFTLAVFSVFIAYVSLVGFFLPKVRLLICTSQIKDDDRGEMALSRFDMQGGKHLDTRRIVVEGSYLDTQRTMHDNISIATSVGNVSDEKHSPQVEA